jgi:hypothetical protein
MSHGIAQLSYIDAIINCFTSLEPTGQTHARFTDHARISCRNEPALLTTVL